MGLDILGGIGLALQLFTQSCHKYPQGGDIIIPAASPYLLRDISMGQDLSHVLGHEAEQLVLDRR